MTIKEAILKSLEDINKLAEYKELTKHIVAKKYHEFQGKTPMATVSSLLGDFIRQGDTRVKRIKIKGKIFYYLSKNEQALGIEKIQNTANETPKKSKENEKSKSYDERDLHELLSSYLKNTGVYSKTIFHEQSNGKDSNQIWTHPDMVGIKFLNLQTKASHDFLSSINKADTFKINSYEIKKEINSDSELKKAFFQAVSNSSWANYGYLVAFEFSDSLSDEMYRLSQAFGIGIVLLKANPFESKVLYPPAYRELDFKTIDKLCNINKDFNEFIVQTEKLMTAEEKFISSTKIEFEDFCDSYFIQDSEFEKYCKEKNIPMEYIDEEEL